MKHHRTLLLVSLISLMLIVAAAGSYPTWLTQRTSAARSSSGVTAAAIERSTAKNQTRFFAEAVEQSQSGTILTLQNAPDIPECREIVNQDILDLVNASSEDPAEVFERNRRAHPHMIMMPPPLECASKLWVAVRQGNRTPVSAISPELLSLRRSPVASFFKLGALNAALGMNTDTANRVE